VKRSRARLRQSETFPSFPIIARAHDQLPSDTDRSPLFQFHGDPTDDDWEPRVADVLFRTRTRGQVQTILDGTNRVHCGNRQDAGS
jgi:hypothetical protein